MSHHRCSCPAANVERIWARHWQRRALRLEHELAVMRRERDELRERLAVLTS